MPDDERPPAPPAATWTPGRRAVPASPSPAAVHAAFDAARLAQARALSGMTKMRLAEEAGVSPAAIGQYEAAVTRPRPHVLSRLAAALDVPLSFFLTGRPHARLDRSEVHFRSLRDARASQRAKAAAFAEQVWELTFALEKRVRLPLVELPGFSGGEVRPGAALPVDPAGAARGLRRAWGLGTGPVGHLVRRLEAHGIVVLASGSDEDLLAVGTFSTSRLPRPVIVLAAGRDDDVHRRRFAAAHELGHLVLHGDAAPGDILRERQADAFAAEFLTPRGSVVPMLPARADLRALSRLRDVWGVPVLSLLRRCRELGLLSDTSASRARQRVESLRDQPGFASQDPAGYPGECPTLLSRAFELACEHGLTLRDLAWELAWSPATVRHLLRDATRPVLRLVDLGS